jgi:hypothetical protein
MHAYVSLSLCQCFVDESRPAEWTRVELHIRII